MRLLTQEILRSMIKGKVLCFSIMYKRLICFLFLAFSFIKNHAQENIAALHSRIGRIVSANLTHEKFKDSTAVYATSIFIDVHKIKGKQDVKYDYNNYDFKSIFTDLSALEKLDYSVILKKAKSKRLVYRVYITVGDSTYKPAVVDIEKMEEAVIKLLAQTDGNREPIGSLILKFDKKVY